MRVYVKNSVELHASGWVRSESSGDWKHPDSPGVDLIMTMVESWAGQLITLDVDCLAESDSYPAEEWSWSVPMLRVARLKTLTELADTGWDRDDTGALAHPDVPAQIVSYMARLAGGYIPVRRETDDTGRRSRHLDYSWYPEMFADYRAADTAQPRRTVRERQIEFRDADLPAALASVTCGFELETQSTEGTTWNSLRELRAVRDEATIAALVDVMLPAYTDRWAVQIELVNRAHALPVTYMNGARDYTAIAGRLADAGITSLADMVAAELPVPPPARMTALLREYVENRLDLTPFMTPAPAPQAFMESRGLLGGLLTVGSDASVGGFEIRTEGGLTPAEFQTAADSVFKLSHEIDVACSFHVHVKVAGIDHKYGERMQQALTEFLIERTGDVPASVLERWRTIRQRTHIQPGVRTEKHSFVFAHPQGTWEFRCFGNVLNAADGVKCLELSVLAMQHAYRVVTGQLPLLSDQLGLTNEGWRLLCVAALQAGTTLTVAYNGAPSRFQSAA